MIINELTSPHFICSKRSHNQCNDDPCTLRASRGLASIVGVFKRVPRGGVGGLETNDCVTI